MAWEKCPFKNWHVWWNFSIWYCSILKYSALPLENMCLICTIPKPFRLYPVFQGDENLKDLDAYWNEFTNCIFVGYQMNANTIVSIY